MFSIDQFSLKGKVAIVTGVGARKKSIGEAYAAGLLNAGAQVVVADISLEGAESAAHELSKLGGSIVAAKVDIANPASVEAMSGVARKAFGGVDILVNNAAIMVEMTRAPVLDVPNEEWHRMMEVNLMGAVNCCRSVVPLMRARGGGKIVNQVSGGAFPPFSVYGITKVALVGLTTALAKNLGPHNINVNAIAPGNTASEAGQMLTGSEDAPLRKLLNVVCALRVDGVPDELVGALLLLCSKAGDWITGQVLHVDGGWIIRP
jgi:NAD(P)-dependent dehydrogenase (short-subunit alcohol dehydrogenase family)